MNALLEKGESKRSLRLVEQLRRRLGEVLRGKAAVVEKVLACLLAQGHLLLEDLPGLGKTTLAKGLAQAIGGRFARVQCTPDLLPGDITGFSVFNQKTREFDFLEGPVFADVLLADEINRTTPRTQSALLEAMAERQVTVDGRRYDLHPSFFVIATQNPIEHHGTYPLPEAQSDRFAMKLTIGYPDRGDELDLLGRAVGGSWAAQDHTPVLQTGDLEGLQQETAAVAVAESVRGYLVDLAGAIRRHPRVPQGLSPRGVLLWQRVAQAWAFLQGRGFVMPGDVQETAAPVLAVRLGPSTAQCLPLIEEILRSVSVPL